MNACAMYPPAQEHRQPPRARVPIRGRRGGLISILEDRKTYGSLSQHNKTTLVDMGASPPGTGETGVQGGINFVGAKAIETIRVVISQIDDY